MLGLATFDLDEYTYGALRAGAIGFQLKDAPQDQLLSAIRVIATGCPSPRRPGTRSGSRHGFAVSRVSPGLSAALSKACSGRPRR
jgi:DNA-binding NarL/FixJ family response regulator